MYEPLQQTQTDIEAPTMSLSQENMNRDDWIDVFISLVIAFLLAVIIVAHYPQFNSKPENIFVAKSSRVSQVPQVSASLPPITVVGDENFKLNHILNGVFVSEDEKIAMVNNRFFNLGDDIDGMKIVSIEPDNIKLESITGILELPLAV